MRNTFFGQTHDGRATRLYALSNQCGLEVVLRDFGATIASLKVPDRAGRVEDVVLGHVSLAEYEHGRFFVGGTIGRHANRIARGEFMLNGMKHIVSRNAPPTIFTGFFFGFHKRLWKAESLTLDSGEGIGFSRVSPDGEEGFPGDLNVTVRFSVSAGNNDLVVDFNAASDRDTIVNFTTHPYFNLAGFRGRDVLGHQLRINARRYAPVDANMIPAGELRDVANSPFDFTRLTEIGARIDADDPQLQLAGGYDHNWALDPDAAEHRAPAAELFEPISGRRLEIFTTEPGIQFYSGNGLDGSIVAKNGAACARRGALCLESQHFPDSPNQPNFPSVILRQGSGFHSKTTYRFSL